MPDFAAALATEAAGFTDGEGRKVIVEEESFTLGAAGVSVDLLGLV